MKKIKPQLLVFNLNKSDFLLEILIIVLNAIASINILNQMEFTYRIFSFVMYTIFFTLIMFLIASKIKVYEKRFGLYLIILSVFQFVRLLFLPNVNKIEFAFILILLTGILGILSSISSYIKSNVREEYLKNKDSRAKENA